MIDTPRTDEEEDACRECGLHFVPEEFARKLERELAEMKRFCDSLMVQRGDLQRELRAITARPEELTTEQFQVLDGMRTIADDHCNGKSELYGVLLEDILERFICLADEKLSRHPNEQRA